MLTIAEAMYRIQCIEHFSVVFTDGVNIADPRKLSGETVARYPFDKAETSFSTVGEWKRHRFHAWFPEWQCHVLLASGKIALDSTTLSEVRASYEDDSDELVEVKQEFNR